MRPSSTPCIPDAPETEGNAPDAEVARLVRQAQSGCRESFELLVDQYSVRLFQFLSRLTPTAQDAEDLTQETFVRAYRALDRYQPRFRFSTWLFTIARRAAANQYRARRPAVELPAERADDAPDPAQVLEAKDQRVHLWELARTLKPGQYQALWLRYGEGFSLQETACILGRTGISTKVLLHRARLALARKFRQKPIKPRP